MHTFPPVCLKLDTAALTQNSQTRTGGECGVKVKIRKGRYTHLAVRKRWHSFSTRDSVCLSLVMYEKSCLKNTHDTHEASDEDTKLDFPRVYSTDEFSLKRCDATDFMIVLKSSVVMCLSGSDKRLMMSGRRL